MSNWIFQGNPERFRIDEAWHERYPQPAWTALPGKHVDAIRPGDRAALWISGESAGVYAIGEVNGFPYQGYQGVDGWVHEEDWNAPAICIPVCVPWLHEPILKDELREYEDFENSLILRMPGGRNPFPVTDAEWDVIVYLAAARNPSQREWIDHDEAFEYA